jgi:hypothetical protein
MAVRLRGSRRLCSVLVLALALTVLLPPPAATGPTPGTSSRSSGHLIIVGGLQISPSDPSIGQMVTAAFRLRNETGRAVTIRRLRAGARGPNACARNWEAPLVDFPAVENLTLRPGEEYLYQQSRAFTVAGDYFAEPVMQDTQGRWGGIQPFPRVWFNVADASGYVPPPECLIVVGGLSLSSSSPGTGDLVTAGFKLRNNSRQAIAIKRLVAGARGPGAERQGWDAPNVDFPAATGVTLQPGQEYIYQASRRFDRPGDYFVEPVYQNTAGKWGGIWPWPRVELEAGTGGGMQLGTVSFPEPPLTCEELAAGVRHCSNAVYHLLIADLSRPGVSAHVVAAHNWTDPERFQAQTVREMAQDAAAKPQCRVVAGINGGYFGPDHHNSEGWTVVNEQTRRDIQAKVQVDSGYPPQHWPSLAIRRDGRAVIGHYLWWNTPARAAVTAGPVFIEQGQVLPTADGALCELRGLPRRYCTEAYGQSVAAINRDGRVLYLLTAEQRTLAEVAKFLLSQKLDVWMAIKLDGSSSAQMVVRLGGALQTVAPSKGGGRVTDAILICSG